MTLDMSALPSLFFFVVFYFTCLNCDAKDAKEDFVSDRECPFLCTCDQYDVNCTNTNVFPDSLPKETERFFLINSTIESVPINAFLDLPNLQEIHFIDCKTTKLRACSFAELERLSMISFERTTIDQIEGNTFSNLINISNIRFIDAKIGEMYSFSFHNIRNVERIDFFDTIIATIHPLAFLSFDNISEIGIMGSTITRFLINGFSKFKDVELMYMSNSQINEWQCGSLDTVLKSGIDFDVVRSNFTCDCKLAWLWTKHSNASLINRTNKCMVTGASLSDTSLSDIDLNQVCPLEKSRGEGCPPLLPSTPHSCSRSFDSPMDPVEKVTYPDYFSRTIGSAASSIKTNNIIICFLVIFIKL